MSDIPELDQVQFDRSVTPGAKPSAVNLEEGAIAINLPDRTLYTKDNHDNVIIVGKDFTNEIEALKAVARIEVTHHNTTGNLLIAGESKVTRVVRSGSGVGTITIIGSKLAVGDIVEVYNANVGNGIVTITNPDGFITLPNGIAETTHTLTGDGAFKLTKYDDFSNNLLIFEVSPIGKT